jgi:hypothetical protein
MSKAQSTRQTGGQNKPLTAEEFFLQLPNGRKYVAYYKHPLAAGLYCKPYFQALGKPTIPAELLEREDLILLDAEPLNETQKRLIAFFDLANMSRLRDFLQANCGALSPEKMYWPDIMTRLCQFADNQGISPDDIKQYPALTYTIWQQQKDDRKPLGDNEAAVYEIIKALPKHRAITGKDLLNRLEKEKDIIIDQSTLTKNIIPFLKKEYGVKNKRGAGYYLIKNSHK